jgi:hypothetical protein
MISEIYEALIEAGVSKEKAKAAAEAVANEQMATKQDIRDVKENLKVLEAKVTMVQWIVSGIGSGVLLLVLKSFWPT